MRYLLFFLPFALSFASEQAAMDELSAGTALGGREIFEIIKSAETVTAQRIDSELAENAATAVAHPEIIILGEAFEPAPEEAAALKAVFTKGATYLSPSKTCEFRANVRYAFVASQGRRVELIICFGCGELEVWRDGKLVSFGPFDGGYGELLAITKRIFPEDEFLAKFDAEVFKDRASRMRVEPPGR